MESHTTSDALTASTEGIRVTVRPAYVPGDSAPAQGRYVFAYQVTITNEGTEPVQLRTRHWIITDAVGKIQEVKGDGVVGEQPRLEPGASHEYTSFCVLESPRGTMRGTYQMFRDGGSSFDAEIPLFSLVAPDKRARDYLN